MPANGPSQPVRFLDVSRKLAGWWWEGTMSSAPTMTIVPARCHHTLTSDSSPTSLTRNVFRMPWANSTMK